MPSRTGDVTIDDAGKSYTGHFRCDRNTLILTVATVGGKRASLGAVAPEALARLLLGQLLQETAKSRKRMEQVNVRKSNPSG